MDNLQTLVNAQIQQPTQCQADFIPSILQGLVKKAFTGCIYFKAGDAEKKIFLENGELCFAASNITDDRLGEILYRRGWLTLDEMTSSACQVQGGVKFGQVLLREGVLSPAKLWEALQLQVSEILLSIMIYPRLEVRIDVSGKPYTSLVFEESSDAIVARCAYYAVMVRKFVAQSSFVGEISFKQGDAETSPGTFRDDIRFLLQQGGSPQEIGNNSRLNSNCLLLEIFRLYLDDRLHVTGEPNIGNELWEEEPRKHLKAVTDDYDILHEQMRHAFLENEVAFPVGELKTFFANRVEKTGLGVRVDSAGGLCPRSLFLTSYQGLYDPKIIAIVADLVSALAKYLIHISRDLLPAGVQVDTIRSVSL